LKKVWTTRELDSYRVAPLYHQLLWNSYSMGLQSQLKFMG